MKFQVGWNNILLCDSCLELSKSKAGILIFVDLWTDSWANITLASIGVVMASNLAFRIEVLLLSELLL